MSSTVAQALRRGTQTAIAESPITIVIIRTIKTEQDGHFAETTETLDPITVRLYWESTTVPQDVTILAGKAQVDRRWSLWGDADADIQAGPRVQDEFVVDGVGRFRVVSVFPRRIGTTPVGIHAQLAQVT